MKGKVSFLMVLGIAALVLTGCFQSASTQEFMQQEGGLKAIITNQPVPDLGGWSFERQVVIDTIVARNKQVNTYTYVYSEYTGKVLKICDSKGYPIPYATQLTNPDKEYAGATIGNPEPTGLYTPNSAEATLVQCVLSDGRVVPTYWENRVFALPYPIVADLELVPTGSASFSVGESP